MKIRVGLIFFLFFIMSITVGCSKEQALTQEEKNFFCINIIQKLEYENLSLDKDALLIFLKDQPDNYLQILNGSDDISLISTDMSRFTHLSSGQIIFIRYTKNQVFEVSARNITIYSPKLKQCLIGWQTFATEEEVDFRIFLELQGATPKEARMLRAGAIFESQKEERAYQERNDKYAYEKRFSPEMGVDGRLATRLNNGEAEVMPEGAVVWVKTLRGVNYLIDLDVSQKEGFLMVKLNPVSIGMFVPLLKSDVAESKRITWSQVKSFLRKSLKKKESSSLIKAVEDYFKKEGFKF